MGNGEINLKVMEKKLSNQNNCKQMENEKGMSRSVHGLIAVQTISEKCSS